MSAVAEYPRADFAANNVDPMMLANALDHIARTAKASRSQTRRIRWIQVRAELALSGSEYRDIDIDLPRKPVSESHEKLQKRMAYHIAIKHQLRDAAQAALNCISELPPTQARVEVVQMLQAAIESAEIVAGQSQGLMTAATQQPQRGE